MTSRLAALGVRSFNLEGPALRQSRTARSLFSLLEIGEGDHERTAVIDFLTLAELDPDLLLEGSEPAGDDATASPPSPADWDLLSRLAGIVSGREAWGERLERLGRALAFRAAEAGTAEDPEAESPPDPRLIAECRRLRHLHALLAKALDRLPREATWSEMSDAVDRLARRVLASGEERDSILDAAASLAALEAILPRTTLGEFTRVLSAELETRGPGEGRFQRGHLFVGNVQAAKSGHGRLSRLEIFTTRAASQRLSTLIMVENTAAAGGTATTSTSTSDWSRRIRS